MYIDQICVEVFGKNYKTYRDDRHLIRKEIKWNME